MGESAGQDGASSGAPPLREPLGEELERLELLNRLSVALSEADSPRDVLRTVFEVVGAERAVFARRASDAPSLLEVVETFGYDGAELGPGQRHPLHVETPLTDALRTTRPVLVTRAEVVQRYPRLGPAPTRDDGLSFAAVPLPARGRLLGVLGLQIRSAPGAAHLDTKLLAAVGERCAHALDRAELLAQALASERQLRTLAENVPDAVFRLDGELRHVFVNAAATEVLGLRASDVLGRRPSESGWPPTLAARVEADAARVLARGAPSVLEVVLDAPGDRVLELRHVPELGTDGEVASVLGIGRDVTVRHRLTEDLRASEARLAAVVEELPMGVGVLDAEGRFVLVNTSLKELVGGPTLPSLDPAQRFRWRASKPTGEPLPPSEWPGARALRGEVVRPGVEFHFTAPSGREFDLVVSAVPFASRRAEMAALVVVEDITERKRELEALRRSEGLFRMLSDANLVGVGFGDLSGRVEHVNDEMLRMMGYDRAAFEAGRVDWARALAPEFEPSTHETTEALLREGVVVGYEKAFLRPDGGRTTFIGGGALIDRATGLHVSVALDISAQKAAEAELRAANQRQSEFLAVLSHELRNPLAPIRTGLDILDRVPSDAPAGQRARAMMRRQVEHLTRLVDDLLDLTRITHGKIELHRDRLDAGAVVRDACHDASGEAEARGLTLEHRLPAEPTWVEADPARLTQMVGNLLANALKFTPRGGRIDVEVEARAEAWAILVRDTGRGIAPEDLDRIFDRFVQADRQLEDARGGMGLGLALVRELAALHGGRVTASSPGLGQGSTFAIELPRSPDVAPRPPGEPAG